MIGNRTRIKVVKNKVAPPFKQADVDIMYGEGISREGSLVDIAADLDIIQKSGAWYSYEGERLGQGRENAKSFLKGNKELAQKVEDQIRAVKILTPADAAVSEDSSDEDELEPGNEE